MSDIDYFEIARILGGRLHRCERPAFSGFNAYRTAAESLRSVVNAAERRQQLTDLDYVRISAAFEKTRQGYEVDRVLIDASLRKEFLREVKKYKVNASDTMICRGLQAIRKSNRYDINLSPTTNRAGVHAEKYFYAAELAFTQLTYQFEFTVDDIVTDADIADSYVSICKKIDSTGSALEYKWAALSLRKQRSLTKKRIEKILHVRPSMITRKFHHFGTLDSIDFSKLPISGGVFAFSENSTKDRYLYIGAAKNIRSAVVPFKNATPFKNLAGEFWLPDSSRIHLEAGHFDRKYFDASPRDLSFRLIDKYKPVFNVPIGLKRMLQEKQAA